MRARAILAVILLAALSPIASAATRNNDDSCDIGLYPAATLLLPYFEVETAGRNFDTFFTVTNVGRLPQIAHVTIWTDWSFPVLNLNLFLTGYDVQSISMYDVIVNGIIAPTNANLTAGGTSSRSLTGKVSASNDANPNLSLAACDQLPGTMAEALRAAVQSALVNGTSNDCGSAAVGSPAATHRTPTTAVGFVTIDVTSRCTPTMPTDPRYYATEILFDNVLTGEYETLDKSPASNFANGSPMVHIRAIPEGGPAGQSPAANTPATPLPYTFYGRFINGQSIDGVPMIPHLDRRQPLGSTFAARWIQRPPSLNTDFKIWREGVSGPVTCSNAASNSALPTEEIVRFDEHENPNNFDPGQLSCVPCPRVIIMLPSTSRTSTAGDNYPPLNSPPGDNAGWMYLNLESRQANQVVNGVLPPRRPSQNWVVVSMTGAGSAAGLFSVAFDATSLGNGCSPPAALSTANNGDTPIGPAPNVNP
jgi:hypothetical protein